MSGKIKLKFHDVDEALNSVVVVFVGENGKINRDISEKWGKIIVDRLQDVIKSEKFGGKIEQSIMLPSESGFGEKLASVLLVGVAPEKEGAKKIDFLKLGGRVQSKLPKGRDASIIAKFPDSDPSSDEIADFALGMRLAAYEFDQYITKKKKDEDVEKKTSIISIISDNSSAAKRSYKSKEGVATGVEIARDLVNEPPNVLTTKEFANRAAKLEELGVEIEILDEKDLKKIGMRALLGVGQGSDQESRVVILKWNGSKQEKSQPVALIGKGVIFDSGGISIKPSSNMEDMKGDMAGAAAVVGAMHAIASRKAKANVIGVLGLVENMPDGKAQRPGDIVTSLSGQTIEIINTDAEGRLVLADLLWYVKEQYKPKCMVNLATLTGAILVALGVDYAGLFSNNDEVANRLTEAGKATDERVWRLPMGPEYDKQMDSKFADMKNAGGRNAGSITAAQFLARFVGDCPWAHLDIAGTAMGSPASEISTGWASGFGVRLLDKFVEEFYEA